MSATKPLLVLVVDDDPRARELVLLIMRHAGYDAIGAQHPQEAMARLLEARPALALVDYLMPGMNGLEFCRWVRQQPEHVAMRFILLTGMDSVEIRAEARRSGVDVVVTKPCARAELLARVNSLLELPPAR